MDLERRVNAGTVVDFLTKAAKPSLNNKFDALAVAIHAIMQLHGFVLIGAGDTMAGAFGSHVNSAGVFAMSFAICLHVVGNE
jgi:hypothetical protein